MKVIPIILLIGLAVSFSAAAQSNEVIDKVLDQNELVYKNGAYFVLTASGMVPETTGPEEAFTALLEKQSEWKLKNPRPEQKMRLGDFSHILMRALDIPGGLLYRIFPGPRYAAKELSYLGIIKKNADPCRDITGSEALQILGDTLEWKGAAQ
jgi:hypothetical protein